MNLSPSQVNTFLRCAKQWYYRYVENLIMPPTGAMVLGSSIHKGIEVNYKQKIDTKVDLPVDNILDAYADEFEERKKETPEDISNKKDIGYRIMGIYHTNISPKIQPILVEEYFEIENDNYRFRGYIDLVTDGITVIDHKFSSRKYNDNQVKYTNQLTAYAWAVEEITGNLPSEVGLDVLVDSKIPLIQELRDKRSKQDIINYKKMIDNILILIQVGIFLPCGDWMTCSWCGYKEVCRVKTNG